MESMTTSILAGADLWVAVSSGLGLSLVGVGLGYFISKYLRKSTQHRLEEEAEDRARRLVRLSRRLAQLHRLLDRAEMR